MKRYIRASSLRYTVVAWVYDKRCADDCKIVTFDTDSIDEAKQWTSKIKKAYGDSVKLIDHSNHSESYIELRDDQMM